MQAILVKLHDGTSYTVNVENYDSVKMTDMLNNNALTVVNINGLIVARSTVKVIVPVTIAPTEPTA
jgi:hypothetical protein